MKTACFVSYSNPHAVSHTLSRDHAAEIIRFYRRRRDIEQLSEHQYVVYGASGEYAVINTKSILAKIRPDAFPIQQFTL